MFEEGFPNLRPLSFFSFGFDCREISVKGWEESIKDKKHKIPDTSFFSLEESFATLFMGWNLEGLYFYVDVQSPVEKTFFPEVSRGDSVELFIDTRDVKTSGFNTKFCHHFFFLPEVADGRDRGEITRFRTEDAHELCNFNELELKSQITRKGYALKIAIPAHCLHGYDPREVGRLGFTYRINRFNGAAQHFSVHTDEFPVEQQPSLWSSVKLVS